MKITIKKFTAGLLALALVVGTAPANVGTGGLFGGTSITAYADVTETLLTTITATGKEQASFSTANVATVSFSYSSGGSSAYHANYGWWGYGWTATVTPVDGYTITKCVFYDDKDRTATDSEAPFVVETTEEDKTPQVNGTPILADTSKGITKIKVYGYATPTTVDVTGISLDKTTAQTVTVGENVAFTATVAPDDATDKTVKWSASNANVMLYSDEACTTEVGTAATDVLTVYAKGITAGNATVTVTSNAEATKTASCDVTVNAATPTIYGPSVTLGDDLALNIYVDGIANDTEAAEYTMNFTGACVDSSSALSYNEKEGKYYATTHVYAKNIDKDITATLCKGSDTVDTLEDYSITQYLSSPAFSGADEKTTALITATQNFGYASAEYFYGDDFGVTATFANYNPDVSAYEPNFTSNEAKLSLVLDSKTAARLYVKGDTTGTESTFSDTKADYPTYHEVTGLLPQNLADEQTITVGGRDYTFSALSWCYRVLSSTSASDKNVNMAKAIMEYYTAAKNYSIVDVSEVSINTPPTRLNVGDTGTFSATVSPDNATDKTVTWSASPSGILTIDSATGAYEAVGTGEVTVTATAGGKTASCTMNVVVPVSGIVINNAPTEALFVNSKGTLTANVSSDNATDKTVVWSSSDPDYVSINAETGEYTIMGTKGYGSATITATATNGTEDTSDDVTATCTITGKVTYTSLSVGTVLHTGDTFYTGSTVYFKVGSTNVTFTANNGVITIIEATKSGYNNKYYQCQRGSNGTYTNWGYVVKDNTDGIYITGGSGTSSDRFTLAVHTK